MKSNKKKEIEGIKRALSQDMEEWDDIQENGPNSPYWEARADVEANIRSLVHRLLNLL